MVLTLGAQGAVYMDGGQTVRQAAFPAQAVDTTAAGDTFTGFFLAARLRGESAAQAMAQAACAAAYSVTRRGAAPSIPTRAQAAAFGYTYIYSDKGQTYAGAAPFAVCGLR